jgi:hypothetical protein
MNRFERYVRAWMQSVEQWETDGFSGAGDGTRTRNFNFGKVALYQLSYARKLAHETELYYKLSRSFSNHALNLILHQKSQLPAAHDNSFAPCVSSASS